MANIPANVAARAQASGVPVGISLLEIQTLSGQRGFYSTAPCIAPSVLSSWDTTDVATGLPVFAQAAVTFVPWIVAQPQFKLTGSLASNTGNVTLQNLSGNTIARDMASLLSKNVVAGAIAIYRYWDPVAEFALFTFNGKVLDAEDEDDVLQLSLVSRMNFSTTKAPAGKISESCNLSYGSPQCGANPAGTPCNNTWGTCVSQNRFSGFVQQWSTASTTPPANAVAQPLQPVEINGRVAG